MNWNEDNFKKFLQVQKLDANDGSKDKLNLLASYEGKSFAQFWIEETAPRFPYEEGSSDIAKARAALEEYLSSSRNFVKYNNETEMYCEVLKNLVHPVRHQEDLKWIETNGDNKFCFIEASLAEKFVKTDAGGNRYFTMAFTEGHTKLFGEFSSFNSMAMRNKQENKAKVK